MMDKSNFGIIAKKIEIDTSKRVSHVQIVIETNDCGAAADSDSATPTVYFTDVMFQGGTVATTWVGHVSEIRWSFDNG